MLKTWKLITMISTVIFTFLFGIAIVGGEILIDNKDAVNAVLGAKTQEFVSAEEDENADLEYYKSAFTSVKDVRANGAAYVETVVREGAVLLKNENGALPLEEGATVNLYSTSSAYPFAFGTTSADDVSIFDGLRAAGLTVNRDLNDWYSAYGAKYGRKSNGQAIGALYTIGDARWDQIDTPAKSSPADVAIFVLARVGGEGNDNILYDPDPNSIYRNDYQDGNYLKLSPTERDVLTNLKRLKDENVIKHIVVLLNYANQVECEFLDDESLGIDAALFVGLFGTTGANAIGDILRGTVNPSGRLSDMFWKYHYLNPVHANYSELVGTTNEKRQNVKTHNPAEGYNIVYQEGVYMGYRYAETRYEDFVLGTPHTGDYDYSGVVSYPFGFGLSYSEFTYDNMKVTRTPATAEREAFYTVSVDVTNTGDAAGKEVVQIYLQRPYTDYDRQNGIEKPAAELVGFTKTKELAPGKKQTVTVEVNERDFAAYDSYKAKTYIVDEGTYYLTAAKDAHDAVNNILEKKGVSAEQKGRMVGSGNAALVFAQEMQFDKETYSVAAATGNKITNQFDDVDLKLYEGAGENADRLVYVSRNNWEGTVKFGLTADNQRTNQQFTVTPTEKMKEDLEWSWDPVVEKDDGEYPTYGSEKTSYMLIDLRAYSDEDDDPTNDEWIPYDDPMWEDFLDQLTWDETVQLLSCAFRKTTALESIAKPETIDQNGGKGPNQRYDVASQEGINHGYAIRTNDPDKGMSPINYPSNGIMASTFNLSLADYYGRQWGEDCLWAGMAGLYGMGVNTHRSPYGGRNFEYYSEDPVLGGKIAAQNAKGMATRGVYVYLKHCFLNDQETYRCGGFTWANEQTIREIYLRQFQIAIEEGGAQCVMGGLNSLGMKWTGVQGFMNPVLRGEFGMTGHVVTDSYGEYNGSYVKGVYYGNDLPDGTVLTQNESFDYASPQNGGYSKMAWAMREACHRMLYTVVHSNAMNTFSSNTRVIRFTPSWVYAIYAVQAVTGVLLAASAVGAGVTLFLLHKKKKEGGTL